MRLVIIAGLLGATLAHADPAERCAAGAQFLAHGDLPRAALYLEACGDDDQPAARRELHKKLEASNLAEVSISSTPAGLDAEIDALPGEHFSTPATVWVPPGTHEVRAGTLTNVVTAKPHAHAVVVLEGAAPPTMLPKNGTVDFGEEAAGESVEKTGPPPEVAHRPMMPCKFTNSCTEAGEQLEDPLAMHASAPPAFPHDAFELRGGVAEKAGALGPSAALVYQVRSPWAGRTLPLFEIIRVDWRRVNGNDFGVDGEIGKVLSAPDTAWISAAVGARWDRSDGMEVLAQISVALRRLPVVISGRWQQDPVWFANHAFVLELGGALRLH